MCPGQSVLVRLLNGELSEATARGVESHLQACAECAAAYRDLRGVWDALEEWQPSAPQTALHDRILQAAAFDNTQPTPAGTGHHSTGWFWTRVAAAVVLASGAGVAAGFVLTRDTATKLPGASHGSDVVQFLGLDALGAHGALTAMFDADDANVATDPGGDKEEQS